MTNCKWCNRQFKGFGSYCSTKCGHEHSVADPATYQSNKETDGFVSVVIIALFAIGAIVLMLKDCS